MPLDRRHLPDLDSCPYLPPVDEVLPASSMRVFGRQERGADFYLAALRCAQSLWRQGFPAQSLLLINRALGADLEGNEAVLEEWPLPYGAAVWVMQTRTTLGYEIRAVGQNAEAAAFAGIPVGRQIGPDDIGVRDPLVGMDDPAFGQLRRLGDPRAAPDPTPKAQPAKPNKGEVSA